MGKRARVSEEGLSPTRHIAGHSGDEPFQTINCTGTDNQEKLHKKTNTNPDTNKQILVKKDVK